MDEDHSRPGSARFGIKPRFPSVFKRKSQKLTVNINSAEENEEVQLRPTSATSARPHTLAGSAMTYRSSSALPDIKETTVMVRDLDPSTGLKTINNYVLLREIGRGVHGKVKLAMDLETGESWVMY